jgi:hypothetical protein
VIERQARERTDAGLPLDGLPDLSAEAERDGFYRAQLIRVASGVSTSDKQSAPPAGGIRVFTHHVSDHQGDAALAQRLADHFATPGLHVAGLRPVDFSIAGPVYGISSRATAPPASAWSRSFVGFFESDTSLAPEHASDFTHYLPRPRPGNVEVWLRTS